MQFRFPCLILVAVPPRADAGVNTKLRRSPYDAGNKPTIRRVILQVQT